MATSRGGFWYKGTSALIFHLLDFICFFLQIDPCTANGNPCNNGATCVALQQGRFMCECLPGWEGQLCETNIDDCAEKPCLLGSNCTDLVGDFSCTCPPGFSGKRCQEKINMCSRNPCKNGVCIDKLFEYECVCDRGWTGELCESNINDCQPNPCQNGGHCVDGIDDYKCTCEPGFTGKKCQHPLGQYILVEIRIGKS